MTAPDAPQLPDRPGTIIAVHLSYASRAAQRGRRPAHPSYFLKPASSVARTGDVVERPAGTELLAFEAEIAVVIGSPAHRITPEQAWDHVAGVTAANDLGVYDLRAADRGSNVRSKGGDGFTPLGPALVPAAVARQHPVRVRSWVNGELRQDDTTDGMLFDLATIVADLSDLLTLHPGDVVLTGTPAGSSVVVPGDEVVVEVDVPATGDSSGRLVTRVVQGEHPIGRYGAGPAVTEEQRREAWGEPALTAPGLTAEQRAALAGVATATLASVLRARGHDHVTLTGPRPSRPGTRLVGTARTLRYVPFRADLFAARGGGQNAQKRVVDTLLPGEVLVVEARGELGAGTAGDIIALRAQALGAAGIVTDGPVRDAAAVAAIDLPVFHAGAHPAVLGRRHVPWDTDVAVACGGCTVEPGDVLVGDDDGVVVIPPALLDEVLAEAVEQERREAFIAARVREGAALDGLFPMGPDWLARYRAEPPDR